MPPAPSILSPGLAVASKISVPLSIVASGVASLIVELAGSVNVIVFEASVAAFASAIASRSEPSPVSLVLVTVKVAACAAARSDEQREDRHRRRAPRDPEPPRRSARRADQAMFGG